jgi:hypothetical protein
MLGLSNSNPVFRNLPLYTKTFSAFSIKTKAWNKLKDEQDMCRALSKTLP